MSNYFNEEDQRAISSFYDKRFIEKGDSIDSVGWKNQETQYLRFEVLLRNLSPKGKTILDFGCGLGDLIPFLDTRFGTDYKYIGVDISEELLKKASDKYKTRNAKFIHGNILKLEIPAFDIALSSGTLSYKISNNNEYAKDVLSNIFSKANEGCSFNFLSSYVDFTLEKNFHYNPQELFSFSKSLTKYVNLIHDYPLYEFTIQLLKKGKKS